MHKSADCFQQKRTEKSKAHASKRMSFLITPSFFFWQMLIENITKR